MVRVAAASGDAANVRTQAIHPGARGSEFIRAGKIALGDDRRIGLALYQGEWQTMLAHGIGITPAAVRAWLSTGSTHVQISPAIRHLITASEYVADDLELWNHPKGTKIVDRMVELIQASRNR